MWQVFIERDGEHEFVGLWSDVEGMNECEALPRDVSGVLHPQQRRAMLGHCLDLA